MPAAFGVIACGAMEPPRLAEEIAGTQALTDKPFGVNLITMHPRLDQLVQVCLEAQGRPHRLRRRHPAGRRDQARPRMAAPRWSASRPALALAKKLVRSGADALVIEGSRGGRAYRPGLA